MKNKMNPFTGEILEFTCMICGEWRLDKFISVLTKPFLWHTDGSVIGEENIRYCNDKIECSKGAKNYSVLKKETKK